MMATPIYLTSCLSPAKLETATASQHQYPDLPNQPSNSQTDLSRESDTVTTLLRFPLVAAFNKVSLISQGLGVKSNLPFLFSRGFYHLPSLLPQASPTLRTWTTSADMYPLLLPPSVIQEKTQRAQQGLNPPTPPSQEGSPAVALDSLKRQTHPLAHQVNAHELIYCDLASHLNKASAHLSTASQHR